MSKPPQFELKARASRLDIGTAGASFWWDALPSVDEELSLPESADVVVIGAGYTGLSAALTLARAGRDVLVFDANPPGTGASTRNLGFFGSALKVSLSGLMRRYGRETAIALSRTARDGFEFSKKIIETESLQEELMRSVLIKPRLCIDTFRIYRAFRPSPDGDRLMFAGRSGDPSAAPARNGEMLRQRMVKLFPMLSDTRISHSWGGYVAFTFDYLPHLGEVDGIPYATGMNGVGVTMAPYLGHRIACEILGQSTDDFILDRFEFKTRPFYSGDPWFLPLVLGYYKLLDRLGI